MNVNSGQPSGSAAAVVRSPCHVIFISAHSFDFLLSLDVCEDVLC